MVVQTGGFEHRETSLTGSLDNNVASTIVIFIVLLRSVTLEQHCPYVLCIFSFNNIKHLGSILREKTG